MTWERATSNDQRYFVRVAAVYRSLPRLPIQEITSASFANWKTTNNRGSICGIDIHYRILS
jgi:hypothetical protein